MDGTQRFRIHIVDLGESELSDAGLYVVQGYDGECPIQNDTISVTFLSEGCTDLYACKPTPHVTMVVATTAAVQDQVVVTKEHFGIDLQQCVVANPSDSNFDGCVQLNDLLDLLSAYGDCGSEESVWQCGDPLEYQGYDYETLQIGEQCWFDENLRALNYLDGSTISNSSIEQILDSCSATIISEVLYDQSVALNENLCPTGWFVPSNLEWDDLELSLVDLNMPLSMRLIGQTRDEVPNDRCLRDWWWKRQWRREI